MLLEAASLNVPIQREDLELAARYEFVGDGEVKKRNNNIEKDYLNFEEDTETAAARAARIREKSQTTEYDH
jgi:hypothetical protein